MSTIDMRKGMVQRFVVFNALLLALAALLLA